jgi:hypothetical protein
MEYVRRQCPCDVLGGRRTIGTMRMRLSTVALNCLKIGGAGSLLSFPIGMINYAAGEATYAGGIVTMLVSGAAWRADDMREMARATLAARRALAPTRVRHGAANTVHISGGDTLIYREGPHVSR